MIDDIEVAAQTLLQSNEAIAAVIGDRVYSDVLPLGVSYPAVSIELISGKRITAPLLANADPNSVDTTLQITAWGPRKAETKAVSKLIRQAIRRWRGEVDGFRIDDITIGLEGPNFYDADLKLYASSNDYIFSHTE